jgi:hypothetical protein
MVGKRVRAVIQSLRFPAAQADVARLLLLRTFGGFWVDLKLEPRCRFLTPLLDFDVVLTEHFPQSNRPEPNGLLINGFIGSDRQTQFIDRVLKRVLLNVEQRVQTSIFDVTGATNLLKVKEEMANLPGGIGSHTVLPHTETWGKLLSLGSAPYNHQGMHWSERELHEPIYNDDVVSAAAKKDQTPNSTGKVGCLPAVTPAVGRGGALVVSVVKHPTRSQR